MLSFLNRGTNGLNISLSVPLGDDRIHCWNVGDTAAVVGVDDALGRDEGDAGGETMGQVECQMPIPEIVCVDKLLYPGDVKGRNHRGWEEGPRRGRRWGGDPITARNDVGKGERLGDKIREAQRGRRLEMGSIVIICITKSYLRAEVLGGFHLPRHFFSYLVGYTF